MERYLFHPDDYEKFYNCSSHTPEKWHSFGKQNVGIGAAYMAIGIMYEILYFPCLYVMASQKFLRLSCYKIMYYLGIIDVSVIIINSCISGFLSIEGAVFCDYPRLMYISGCISLGLWCSACMACMLLAINRMFDLLKPQWMESLFGGNKTYVWLIGPIAYGLYFIVFTTPLIYSSNYNAAFFDPFTATDKADGELYTNWPHTINNFIVITVLCSAYTCVCVYVIFKSKFVSTGATTSSGRHGMSAMQRQIVIQATMICGLILIAAMVYVRMQFFETPGWMIVVGQVTWQSSHGGAVFIYLFLNRTMRREIIKTFFSSGIFGSKSGSSTTATTAKVNASKQIYSISASKGEDEDESTRY